MRARCVRGSGRNTCASRLNATKPDRTIVLECDGRDCTNSMVRCGASSPHTAKNQHALPEIFPSPRGWPTALCSDRIRVASVSTNGLGIDGIERRHGRISRACGVLKAPRCFSVQERHPTERPSDMCCYLCSSVRLLSVKPHTLSNKSPTLRALPRKPSPALGLGRSPDLAPPGAEAIQWN